jgi:hypothetical protein
MKKSLLLLVLLTLAVSAGAQVTSDFALVVHPSLSIPVGPKLDDGTPLYSVGGGLSLKGEYVLPFFQYLYTGLALDVDLAPMNNAGRAVTFLSAGPVLGFRFSPIPRFNIKAYGYGGGYLGMISEGSAPNLFAAGGLDFSFLVTPALNLGVGAAYKHNFTAGGALYQAIAVNLGAQYNIGAGRRRAEIQVFPEIRQIFPLFYTFYDENPVGTLSLKNEARDRIQDLKISFFVKQYMDQPKESAEVPLLKREEEIEVPVYGLFNEEIFKVTEGTKVAGEIILNYRYLGMEFSDSYPVTVTVNNRNAMTWDDDRKAAAFVTAKDPVVLSFAKQVASVAGAYGSTAVNASFRTALALFEALSRYGIGYVVDPTTPYAELSENSAAVDYLQFPSQTLAYKAGDCDDISILYAALLEAVGIRTAFITAPGHIYMAFALGIEPESARRIFLRPEDLIFRDGDTWVPVEITLVRDGFIKAWQIGAKEWRETSNSGTAGFYPVGEAWQVYEPVGFGEYQAAILLPSADEIQREYSLELDRFIRAEVEPQASKLKEQIRDSGGSLRLVNSLGVLYARYGLLREAAAQFEQIIRRGEYPAALVNLGNIAYLQGDMREALRYYGRALERSPENSVALLGVAKASYELEQYEAVDGALTRLKTLAPEVADKFSYLGSGEAGTARASRAVTKEISIWDEE